MVHYRHMYFELLVLLLLVVVNGLFSGAEIAVLTAPKGKLEGSDGRARAVRSLRASPERFLATVQIGITVVSAAAAAFGGASIAGDLAPYLTGMFGSRAHQVAMVLVVAIVSFLSLVLGELVPKSLALQYATGYSRLIGRPLLWLSRAMSPLVWFLTACSNVVLKLFGDKTSFTETRASREEIRELVKEAAKSGSIDPKSSEIASRAIEFGEVTVAEVMVHRDQIIAIDRRASVAEVQQRVLGDAHSRLPVYDGTVDKVLGYVLARDVLALAWSEEAGSIEGVLRPVIHVPGNARSSSVLRELQSKRTQLAIVVDEAGHTLGLVTMEDLMEELVGEIYGEHELPEATMKLDEEGTALVPGWVPIRKVNRALQTSLPVGGESMTIAGLCMTLALAIPEAGTRLTAPDGTVLEVVEATPRRVRLVRIHRRSEQVPADEGEGDQALAS